MGDDRRVQGTVASASIKFLRDKWQTCWPATSASGKDVTLLRVAFRVLLAHETCPTGYEWVLTAAGRADEQVPRDLVGRIVAKNGATPDGDDSDEPDSHDSEKVEVLLLESDFTRFKRLLERDEYKIRRSVWLRRAVALLHQITIRLIEGYELRERYLSQRTTKRIELLPFVQGGLERMEVTLQSGRSAPSTIPPRASVLRSSQIEEFFSAFWFTAAFNHWLAVKVEEVTHELQHSAEKGVEALADESQRWQSKLDILTLHETFWRQERDTGIEGPESWLFLELLEQSVLPGEWRTETRERLHLLAEQGADIVGKYLRSRFARLRPWRSPRDRQEGNARGRSGGEDGPRRGTQSLAWRSWTRSRDTFDGHREVSATLEWTAVVHHWLCNHACTPALAAHDLQTLLVDAFGVRHSLHLTNLAETCVQFNLAFYDRPSVSGNPALEDEGRVLSLSALLGRLCPKAPSGEAFSGLSLREGEEEPERQRVASLIYLLLTVARVVQPVYRWRFKDASGREKNASPLTFHDVKLGIRSAAYADLSELRARMFGAQTTLSGLHWILRGGIVPRSKRGRVWLVHGAAGAGKSTFGLALAADMARRGRVAIVVCADERADAIRERLASFGLLDESRYEVVERNSFAERLRDDATATCDDGSPFVKGLLVIFGAGDSASELARDDATPERLDLSSWLEDVSEASQRLYRAYADSEKDEPSENRKARLRALGRKWRWMSVVIDSIDTLQVELPDLLRGGEATLDRRPAMARLVQSVEASRLWAIMLCGQDNPNRTPLTYLADTVIEIGGDESGLRRQLQIRKCRSQAYDAGSHVLQLVEGTGVAVYPNLASTQRAARFRIRRHLDDQHVITIRERIYWPGSPEREAAGSAQADGSLLQLRRGSSVLLYGPPQSGKGPLLLNIMSQRMEVPGRPWELGATGAVLLVSFRASAQECLRPLEKSRSLGQQWRRNVSDVQLQWYGADDTVHASQVAYDLVRRIQRVRRDGVPFDWIAFLGVEALATNLPTVEAERSFWPTVLAITAAEEITTAFVVAGTEHRFIAQHKQDMDYVFKFAHGEESDRRTVNIEKSAEPPPAGGYPRLLVDLQRGTVSSESV